jgi:hypothetical protein
MEINIPVPKTDLEPGKKEKPLLVKRFVAI